MSEKMENSPDHQDQLAKREVVEKATELATDARARIADINEPLLQFFAYDHLPEHLQGASLPFAVLAKHIVANLPRNPERTVALRKLLESKDCAVRAALFK